MSRHCSTQSLCSSKETQIVQPQIFTNKDYTYWIILLLNQVYFTSYIQVLYYIGIKSLTVHFVNINISSRIISTMPIISDMYNNRVSTYYSRCLHHTILNNIPPYYLLILYCPICIVRVSISKCLIKDGYAESLKMEPCSEVAIVFIIYCRARWGLHCLWWTRR